MNAHYVKASLVLMPVTVLNLQLSTQSIRCRTRVFCYHFKVFENVDCKLEESCLSTELTKLRNDSSFLFLGCASVSKGRAKTIALKTSGPYVSPNYVTKRSH